MFDIKSDLKPLNFYDIKVLILKNSQTDKHHTFSMTFCPDSPETMGNSSNSLRTNVSVSFERQI